MVMMMCDAMNQGRRVDALILPFVLFMMTSTRLNAQIDTVQTHVPPLKQVYANDFHFVCLLSCRQVVFPIDPPVLGQIARLRFPWHNEMVKR